MSGELNLITLKAVQKERVQRYDSARALSDDIERFLDSRPVKACPPTFAYRFRKYAVKHRSAVAAAAALTIAIFGGAAATLWQARTAIRERAIAVAQRAEAITQRAQALRERGRAETEATRATELEQRARDGKQDIQQLANAMLFQLDDQLKDTGSLAARTTLLNLGVQYLQKADSADPNLGAAYFRVAELQESLRDTERAEASYRRSAELLRQRLAGDPRNMEARRLLACDLLGLANLDETYEGRNARLREAEAHLRSVLAVEPGNGRAMLDLSRVLVEEGQPWPVSMSGRLGSGERSPEEAVRFALQGSQADHNKPSDLLVLAEAQEAMSNWVLTQRNAIEDIHWLEEAVSTLDGATRQEPSNTKALVGLSVALLKLARHLRDRDEQEKSLAAVNRAVETARQAVAIDPQNPSVRIQAARSLGDLANFSSRRRGIEQYRAACAEVTRLYREQMAAHPDVVQHRVDFAGWLLAQGVVERAAENGREYLNFAQKGVEELREVDRKRPGDLRIRSILAAFLDMVSEAHVQLREYPQARAVAEESVALERALVRQSPGAVTSLKLTAAEGRLATALKLMGQTSAAIEQLRASSAIFRSMRDLVRKDRLVLFAASIAQAELASLYASQRNWAGQLAAIQELSEVLHAKYAENPYEPTVAVALSRSLYGSRDICMQRSELEKSLTFSRQLVDIAQKVASANPRQPSRVSWLEGARIGLLFDLGQAGLRDEALAVNREAAAAIAGRLAGGSSQNEVVTRNVDHAVDISRSFAILDEPAEALRLSGCRAACSQRP